MSLEGTIESLKACRNEKRSCQDCGYRLNGCGEALDSDILYYLNVLQCALAVMGVQSDGIETGPKAEPSDEIGVTTHAAGLKRVTYCFGFSEEGRGKLT